MKIRITISHFRREFTEAEIEAKSPDHVYAYVGNIYDYVVACKEPWVLDQTNKTRAWPTVAVTHADGLQVESIPLRHQDLVLGDNGVVLSALPKNTARIGLRQALNTVLAANAHLCLDTQEERAKLREALLEHFENPEIWR